MKSLLDAVGQNGLDRFGERRQQRDLFLRFFRQSADDQNADDKQNTSDEHESLRESADRDQIKRRVNAAENHHLAEIFQNEERHEGKYRHEDERHDVFARGTPQ